MPNDRPTRLLDAFAEITAAAPRPAPRRVGMRSGFPVATLAGAIAIVAAVAVAGTLLGRPAPNPEPGAIASPTLEASAPAVVVTPQPTAAATPEPTIAVTPSPTAVATPEPTAGPCDPATLAVRITSWEGAAGQRIANVELVNHGSLTCLLEARNHPQLVDGNGSVLIDGKNPATTPVLALEPGAKVTTLVAAGNYCGPAPVPPVSVAFVLGDGRRLIAATTDATDEPIPPCNGPGQPGTVEMHPWAR
jgi:hypothetical protein